jgi:hypothetical protein
MLQDEGFERIKFLRFLDALSGLKNPEHIQEDIRMEINLLVEVLLRGFDAIPGSGRLFVSNREGIPCGGP